MNIFYVLARKDFFELGVNGRVSHARGIIQGLVNNNVNVTVFSSKSASNYCNELAIYEKISGASILWYFNLIFSLLKKRKVSDFIIVRYSTSLGWFFCVFLNIFVGKKWGFELNGLGYHQLKGKHSFIEKILFHFERYVISKAPFVNCVSNSLSEEVKEVNSSVTTLPNAGYELNGLAESVIFEPSSDTLNIVYMGMYHSYYDLVTFSKIISGLDGVNLHLYGSGSQELELNAIAKSSSNVFIHGRYDFDKLVGSGDLNGKTLLVLPYKSGTVADYGSPTKLFEYLSLALPILSTCVGQPKDILEPLKSNVTNSVFFYENSALINVIEELKRKDLFLNRHEILNYYSSNHTWSSRCEQYLIKISDFIDSTYEN